MSMSEELKPTGIEAMVCEDIAASGGSLIKDSLSESGGSRL